MAEDHSVKSELETEIRAISGVISAVVFNDRAGRPVEVQAFTKGGFPEQQIRKKIGEALAHHGRIQDAQRIIVFQLAGGPIRGRPGEPNVKGARPSWADPRRSGTRPATSAARGKSRPKIGKISLAGNGPNAEASVRLIFNGKEAEGLGRARRTIYSLRVTAAATLEAAQALVGQPGLLALEGVSLVEVMKRRVVIVMAHSAIGGGRLVVGSSLVGDTPVHAATVRAALDAVNRQLDLAISN